MTSRRLLSPVLAPAALAALAALAAAVTFAGCASTPAPTAASVPDDPAFAPVAWLEGAWARTDDRGRRTEEYWTPPRAGTMFGMNRVIANGKTVFFENLCIEAQEDGTLVYLASPKGRQPPTPFRLVGVTGDAVVFENPEHDFPQRIVYELAPDGGLRMEISGAPNGVDRRAEWVLTRQ